MKRNRFIATPSSEDQLLIFRLVGTGSHINITHFNMLIHLNILFYCFAFGVSIELLEGTGFQFSGHLRRATFSYTGFPLFQFFLVFSFICVGNIEDHDVSKKRLTLLFLSGSCYKY